MRTILILFCLSPFFAAAQNNIKPYVQQQTVKINTNSPDSLDFTDLEAFGNAIGNARIVLLGEQDHGDAPAFLAKTRLVKYLHEQKGFNVLAFETDFFGMTAGWDALEKTAPAIDSFTRSNVFSIWSYCDACAGLFNYIPNTLASAAPLQLSGFDNQMVHRYARKNLSRMMDSIMRVYDLPITKEANYTTEIVPLIDSLKNYTMTDESRYEPQYRYLLRIKEELSKKVPANNYWLVITDNLISENLEYKNIRHYNASSTVRDRQMAKNLAWLATTKFPQEKIIVWAHNAHISKYSGHYDRTFWNERTSMGTFLDDSSGLKDQTYTLGFTSFEGEAGRLGTKPFKVKKPAGNGFERWINTEYAFAFTDFLPFNKMNPGFTAGFDMKGSVGMAHRNQTARWNKIFDGVFFVREMYPCKSVISLK